MASIRTLDQSAWAILNNASLLAFEENISLAASYQMRFNLEELSSRSLSGIIPTKLGVFSGLVLQNGYNKSLYTRYGLSYSRSFGHSTSAFFQYNYMTHHIEATDRSQGSFSSLGLYHKISQAVQLGLFIQNPEQAKIKYQENSYPLPTLYNVGIAWVNGQSVRIIAEVEKELNYRPVYKAAIQFAFKNRLFIRSGIKGQPVEFSFGGGFLVSNLNIDVGFLYHQNLGLSSGIGLSYSFKKSGK